MFVRQCKSAAGVVRTTTFALLALGIGAMALLAGDANAAPLAVAKGTISQQGAQGGDVTLVRDQCGRGRRFSNSRQRCVAEFDRGPPECPRGMRFSNSRQACVERGGGGDPGAAVLNSIINQAIGNSGRRDRDGCGRGMRFSNSRQRCVPN